MGLNLVKETMTYLEFETQDLGFGLNLGIKLHSQDLWLPGSCTVFSLVVVTTLGV